MESKSRTLPASERRALETALKLMNMDMVPNRPWDACNMGRVTNEYISSHPPCTNEYKVKRRNVSFEWKRQVFSNEHKLTLKIELMAEIPLVDGKELHYENADDFIERWKVGSIAISREGVAIDTKYLDRIFELRGRDFIKFLLADPKLRWEDSTVN